MKRFFAKIRWRIRSFSSDHPALKSRWGDAKSRWGEASPLQFKCWAYPKQKFWVRQWIGDRLKKIFKDFFFGEHLRLGPWPWPRAFLSLASRVSVLGKAVLGLGLEPYVLDSTSGIYWPLLAKDRYNNGNVSPSERLITLVWALINQLSAINRLR